MWEAIRVSRDEWHVVPADDLIEHELKTECVCIPEPELISDRADGGSAWLYVHASLDGRESRE